MAAQPLPRARDDRQGNAPLSRVPTVTAVDTEANTADETPAHALHVLDATGDTRTIWNPEIQDEVDAAKATFRKLKDKGYLAYRVDAEGEQGEVISTFDPKAGKIIMTRPYTGG
jgi:beta-lactam-binding protein with PASTA domain